VDAALFDAVQALTLANTQQRRRKPTRVSTMALKGLIFDADGQPMSPTFGYGAKGQIYRYYVSADVQQGRRRAQDDDEIRRVPAEAVESLVLARLRRVGRRARPDLAWASALAMLRRVEVHATTVQLRLDGAALFGAHVDLEREIARFSGGLPPGERALLDPVEPTSVRLVMPVRLKLRGGRCWLVTPEGAPALARAKVDAALVKALRAAHRLAAALDGAESSGAPASAYERILCTLAFLAPDIQRAILEGRQPPGFNLQRLIHGAIPLAWADQRATFGF
jgi:hypothetical protein